MLFGIFSTLLSIQDRYTERDAERATSLLVADGICSMVMGALLGGPFVAAFALTMGASHYDIGLLAALGFLSQPMQLAGLYLLRVFPRRRAITVLCATTARLLWLLIILIPVLFVDEGKTFLLQWLFISSLIAAIPGPAWNSWVRDLVRPDELGHVFSRRMFWGTAVTLPLTLLGGAFVDWWTVSLPHAVLYAYSLLFLVGQAFGLARMYALSRMPEPPMAQAGEPAERWFESLRLPFQDRNFRQLLWFLGSWSFVINMATPFYVIYMLERIGLSMTWVSLLTVVNQLAHIVSLRAWGRLADRHSNKSILAAAAPLLLATIIAWDFTTLPDRYVLTVPLLFGIHLLSGIAMAGVALGTNNLSLKLSPREAAHTYMTVLGLVVALTGAVAPLVGGLIADLFASREFSVSINWTEPARQVSVYALSLKALDFLFLTALLAGLFSLTKLKRVNEGGEVSQRNVLQELATQIVLPFRIVPGLAAARRAMSLPVSAARSVATRLGATIPRDEAVSPSEKAPDGHHTASTTAGRRWTADA